MIPENPIPDGQTEHGSWFIFDDDGFPFSIGNSAYITREEMVAECSRKDRIARVEFVPRSDPRHHALISQHAGIPL